MYGLYKKNESNFAVMWIIAFVVLSIVSDSFSASLGIAKIITAPMGIVLSLLIYGFIKKHDLLEKYGLCSFKGNLKNYLYFIPLVLLISMQFRNGVTMRGSVFEAVLFIVSMLCVGFLEEVIFRGFLFKSMCKDNVKMAIFVSSITFGMGHIVNLLNGRDLIPTLIQICYATTIGFVFMIIFYKGKSLWPCIITHGVFNALSLFGIEDSSGMSKIIVAAVICVLCIGYALWILRTTKKYD
ncbi:MAG: lysostaphin resistance A-like protein [Cellulosilyticaceae bacterium]